MSSRQLEERQARERVAWVATATGLSPAELEKLVWDIHAIDGHDDATYGYRVEFDPDTAPAIIKRIGGHSVSLGYPPESPDL